jgi:hypothetical protein
MEIRISDLRNAISGKSLGNLGVSAVRGVAATVRGPTELGGTERLAEGFDAKVGDFSKVRIIFGSDENAEPKTSGSGGHGQVVLRDFLAGSGELGEDIGIVFRGEGTEWFDPGDLADRFQTGPPFTGAGGILGQADSHEGFGPNHGGENDFLVRRDGPEDGRILRSFPSD